MSGRKVMSVQPYSFFLLIEPPSPGRNTALFHPEMGFQESRGDDLMGYFVLATVISWRRVEIRPYFIPRWVSRGLAGTIWRGISSLRVFVVTECVTSAELCASFDIRGSKSREKGVIPVTSAEFEVCFCSRDTDVQLLLMVHGAEDRQEEEIEGEEEIE